MTRNSDRREAGHYNPNPQTALARPVDPRSRRACGAPGLGYKRPMPRPSLVIVSPALASASCAVTRPSHVTLKSRRLGSAQRAEHKVNSVSDCVASALTSIRKSRTSLLMTMRPTISARV